MKPHNFKPGDEVFVLRGTHKHNVGIIDSIYDKDARKPCIRIDFKGVYVCSFDPENLELGNFSNLSRQDKADDVIPNLSVALCTRLPHNKKPLDYGKRYILFMLNAYCKINNITLENFLKNVFPKLEEDKIYSLCSNIKAHKISTRCHTEILHYEPFETFSNKLEDEASFYDKIYYREKSYFMCVDPMDNKDDVLGKLYVWHDEWERDPNDPKRDYEHGIRKLRPFLEDMEVFGDTLCYKEIFMKEGYDPERDALTEAEAYYREKLFDFPEEIIQRYLDNLSDD